MKQMKKNINKTFNFVDLLIDGIDVVVPLNQKTKVSDVAVSEMCVNSDAFTFYLINTDNPTMNKTVVTISSPQNLPEEVKQMLNIDKNASGPMDIHVFGYFNKLKTGNFSSRFFDGTGLEKIAWDIIQKVEDVGKRIKLLGLDKEQSIKWMTKILGSLMKSSPEKINDNKGDLTVHKTDDALQVYKIGHNILPNFARAVNIFSKNEENISKQGLTEVEKGVFLTVRDIHGELFKFKGQIDKMTFKLFIDTHSLIDDMFVALYEKHFTFNFNVTVNGKKKKY